MSLPTEVEPGAVNTFLYKMIFHINNTIRMSVCLSVCLSVIFSSTPQHGVMWYMVRTEIYTDGF